ncbi:hypothetical protein BY996DRAFT_4645738 [Phakopsora pachyrhizi]|nr:hypothetical protein BY996DRAFT_4645738 [Phakopsora pachyrhizi]
MSSSQFRLNQINSVEHLTDQNHSKSTTSQIPTDSSSPSPASPVSQNYQNAFLPFELRQLIRPVFSQKLEKGTVSETTSKNPFIRSVDGYNSFLWTGSSDGRVRGFEIKSMPPTSSSSRVGTDQKAQQNSQFSNVRPSDVASIKSSSSLSSPKSPEIQRSERIRDLTTSCFQDSQIFPVGSENSRPRAVERLVLMPVIGLAFILSEGTVTFHSITDLEPRPTSSFPSIRGVSSVALDEETYESRSISSRYHKPPEVMMCVIKKKTIHLLLLRENGVQQIKELPFASAAFQSLLRGSVLLLSDIKQYYLVSLGERPGEVIPLLPISQSTSADANDKQPSSQSSRHRPSMSAIPNCDEFLVASHTGNTCLGIFVSSAGEPSRGTLEWPSNPRSISVDFKHVLALLFDETIEIHLLATQELIQVIKLPSGLEPRTLSTSQLGITLPGDTSHFQLTTLTFALSSPADSDRKVSPSIRQSSKSRWNSLSASFSRILLVGKDSLHALATRTLLAEVELLIAHNRWEDALRLVDQPENNTDRTYSPPKSKNDFRDSPEILYLYQKFGLNSLFQLKFNEASQHWFKGRGDPRVLIRLFPYLSSFQICKDDEIEIYQGLEDFVRDGKSVEDMITDNLVQNYSPHIKPDVARALSTVDLKSQLIEKAKKMLLKYLRMWKRDRLIKGGASDNSYRHLMSVVDNTLAELLSEHRKIDKHCYTELEILLERPNACIFEYLESALLRNQCYSLLADLCAKNQQFEKALNFWRRLHDKEWVDEAFCASWDKIFNILINIDQADLVSEYAIWIASHNPQLSLRVLTESKVSNLIDVPQTLKSLKNQNDEAYQTYLEHLVLWSSRPAENPRSDKQVPKSLDFFSLKTELILGYLKRLKEILGTSPSSNNPAMTLFRDLINDYISHDSDDYSVKKPSFLETLISIQKSDDIRVDKDKEEALRTRIKTIICLDLSVYSQAPYDAAMVRSLIEDMGGGPEVLALERAMVYAALGLHRQALSLLALTLKDISLAEIYCIRGGSLISASQLKQLVEVYKLPKSISIEKNNPVIKVDTAKVEVFGATTTTDLIRILFDLLINSPSTSSNVLNMILSKHGSNIPLELTLKNDRLFDSSAFKDEGTAMKGRTNNINSKYLIQGFRSLEHEKYESRIIKSLEFCRFISTQIKLEEVEQEKKCLKRNKENKELTKK